MKKFFYAFVAADPSVPSTSTGGVSNTAASTDGFSNSVVAIAMGGVAAYLLSQPASGQTAPGTGYASGTGLGALGSQYQSALTLYGK